MQDVVRGEIVLLLEARVRDPGHHRELLVGVGQAGEKLDQVLEACDAVELAAHDDRRHGDFRRVDEREL
jgi:hypothetical protein